jgi:hypothetical protein
MKRLTEDLSFISGISFRFSTQIHKEMPISKETAKKIASQPGYESGKEMTIKKTKQGGYRLFTRVDGKWMDASLEDIK